MKAKEFTFSEIIQIEGNLWHYHVPKYQREYTWKKYNWEKLIEDIYEDDLGHYMGSIICVNDDEELNPNTELIYEVVDGQQRLTTISVLLMAIYQKYKFILPKEKDFVEDEDYTDNINSVRKKLVKKSKIFNGKLPVGSFLDSNLACFLRVQPSSQSHNLEDYKFILSQIELLSEVKKPKNFGNRLLGRAYSFFLEQIPNDRTSLENLIDRVNKMNFVHIAVKSQSKAFVLFETLNYRGVPLSAIDIIKNKMLSVMEIKHSVNIDSSYNKWQELLEYLPEYTEQDRYLRQYYNAFKYDINIKVENIAKATSTTLIKIYEKLINKNANNVFNELINKAKIYNQFIEPENYDETPVINALADLERIGAAASYTLLLYLFSLKSNQYQNDNFLLDVVNLMAKYYVRRNITDFPNTRDLDAINIEVIEKCNEYLLNGNLLTSDFIYSSLLSGKGKPSDIEKFKQNLSNNLFNYNSGMARYVLTKLDSINHTREYKPDLWARNDKGKYIWTVEHIFPQGDNIPKDWIEMIANGDKRKAEEIQDKYVDCLGNLTLSGYNPNLSNYSFEKKQKLELKNVLGNKIKIGYLNGLGLNNISYKINGEEFNIANAKYWNKASIIARNSVMVDMLLELYKFDNE